MPFGGKVHNEFVGIGVVLSGSLQCPTIVIIRRYEVRIYYRTHDSRETISVVQLEVGIAGARLRLTGELEAQLRSSRLDYNY